MSAKKSTAFSKMPPKPSIAPEADKWVGAQTPDISEARRPMSETKDSEPMKRFTIDVSETLHKRIKAKCANEGVKMADVIRDILEREFPAG